MEKGKKNANSIAKAYLLAYNVLQCGGWTYIYILTCIHISQNGFTPKGLFSATEVPLKIFQTAAILEVLHCAVGIVPSSTFITAMQVASRVCIVWPVTHSVKEVQDNMGVLMFLLAWSITEIIRYSLYAFNLVQYQLPILQWCRYTFFIALYPIGVTGEILTVYNALPYVKESQIYSFSLPNALNFSFSFHFALLCCLAGYLPAFLMLYSHMFRQRKKVLGRRNQELGKRD